jgi:hypothetical protein
MILLLKRRKQQTSDVSDTFIASKAISTNFVALASLNGKAFPYKILPNIIRFSNLIRSSEGVFARYDYKLKLTKGEICAT